MYIFQKTDYFKGKKKYICPGPLVHDKIIINRHVPSTQSVDRDVFLISTWTTVVFASIFLMSDEDFLFFFFSPWHASIKRYGFFFPRIEMIYIIFSNSKLSSGFIIFILEKETKCKRILIFFFYELKHNFFYKKFNKTLIKSFLLLIRWHVYFRSMMLFRE